MTRQKVYEAIDSERLHQDRKWGTMETIRAALEDYVNSVPAPQLGWRALSALDALQEGRERMQADSRRLDAMIEHSWKVVHMPSHKDGPWHVWKPRSPELQRVHVATADDPRAAIDAAIGEPAANCQVLVDSSDIDAATGTADDQIDP